MFINIRFFTIIILYVIALMPVYALAGGDDIIEILITFKPDDVKAFNAKQTKDESYYENVLSSLDTQSAEAKVGIARASRYSHYDNNGLALSRILEYQKILVTSLPVSLSVTDAQNYTEQLKYDNPNIEHVYPNYKVKTASFIADSWYSGHIFLPWLRQDLYLNSETTDKPAKLNLPNAVDFLHDTIGIGNISNVNNATPQYIAVVDTGTMLYHQDLIGALATDDEDNPIGYSALGDDTIQDQGCASRLSTWHGTSVAGAIAASNNGIGINGINHQDQSIITVKALNGCGTGTTADMIDALEYIYDLTDNTNIHHDYVPKVVNLSIEVVSVCMPGTQDVIDRLIAENITVIAATGNKSIITSLTSPANCSGVISIASVNTDGSKASYSNYGDSTTFGAFGGDIDPHDDSGGFVILSSTDNNGTTEDSTLINSAYSITQGTSFAAPVASGVISLMLQLDNSLTTSEIKDYLILSSINNSILTNQGEHLGYGNLNAHRALRLIDANNNSSTNMLNNSSYAVDNFTLEVTETGAQIQRICIDNDCGNMRQVDFSASWDKIESHPDGDPEGYIIEYISGDNSDISFNSTKVKFAHKITQNESSENVSFSLVTHYNSNYTHRKFRVRAFNTDNQSTDYEKWWIASLEGNDNSSAEDGNDNSSPPEDGDGNSSPPEDGDGNSSSVDANNNSLSDSGGSISYFIVLMLGFILLINGRKSYNVKN